jgi:hypothetical protein
MKPSLLLRASLVILCILGSIVYLFYVQDMPYVHKDATQQSHQPDQAIFSDPSLGITFKYPVSKVPLQFSKVPFDSVEASLRGSFISNPFALAQNTVEQEVWKNAQGLILFTATNQVSPYFGALSRKSIDPNNTQQQFVDAGFYPNKHVLATKKLSERSYLVISNTYGGPPIFRVDVLTPLEGVHPNLLIPIDVNNLTDAHENLVTPPPIGECEDSLCFPQVAKLILQGTYSKILNKRITAAQTIADSVKSIPIPPIPSKNHITAAARDQWINLLRWPSGCLLDSMLNNDSAISHSLNFYPLATKKYLVEIICDPGAYLYSYHYSIWDESGSQPRATLLTTQSLLGTPHFDSATQSINLFYHSGAGDCGTISTYKIISNTLQLIDTVPNTQCR